jgi:hypothetical protein
MWNAVDAELFSGAKSAYNDKSNWYIQLQSDMTTTPVIEWHYDRREDTGIAWYNPDIAEGNPKVVDGFRIYATRAYGEPSVTVVFHPAPGPLLRDYTEVTWLWENCDGWFHTAKITENLDYGFDTLHLTFNEQSILGAAE